LIVAEWMLMRFDVGIGIDFGAADAELMIFFR
jgi:hypothetical protein